MQGIVVSLQLSLKNERDEKEKVQALLNEVYEVYAVGQAAVPPHEAQVPCQSKDRPCLYDTQQRMQRMGSQVGGRRNSVESRQTTTGNESERALRLQAIRCHSTSSVKSESMKQKGNGPFPMFLMRTRPGNRQSGYVKTIRHQDPRWQPRKR